VQKVFLEAGLSASDGAYLPPVHKRDASAVHAACITDFSAGVASAAQNRPCHASRAPRRGLTAKETVTVKRDADGISLSIRLWMSSKIAVIERPYHTGNVAVALLKDYGSGMVRSQ
jgi:hypothetical protein